MTTLMGGEMRSLLLLAALFFSAIAQSAPVTWDLNGVTFDDGTSVTGWFTYDADTGIYEDFSISVDYADEIYSCRDCGDGATYLFFEGITYTPENSTIDVGGNNFGSFTLTNFFECHVQCVQELTLGFADFLTNSGGMVQLQTPDCERPCSMSYENATWLITGQFFVADRSIVSGSVSAVPIPAAAWLFGSGLGLLGWVRRRNTD